MFFPYPWLLNVGIQSNQVNATFNSQPHHILKLSHLISETHYFGVKYMLNFICIEYVELHNEEPLKYLPYIIIYYCISNHLVFSHSKLHTPYQLHEGIRFHTHM